MAALFQSGTIADLIIGVMVIEGLVLIALRSRLRDVQVYDIVAMLAAGLFLVLALRATLTGAGWPWIAGFLIAAFAAHLFDLRRRLARPPAPTG